VVVIDEDRRVDERPYELAPDLSCAHIPSASVRRKELFRAGPR
jgi:hypothetical protein